MSDYSRSIDFTAKDALTTGDPNKIVKGSDVDSELDAIGTASVTKANKYPPVASGNVAVLSAAGDLVDGLVTSTELGILDGVTVTTAELNLLDGVTATTAELNTMDGITASVVELNLMDGVTATTAEINIVDGITATLAEINLLDGVTATTAEINLLDGVTATTAELNILDGVTASATELNLMDGVTSTTAEINILDGVTANASEINGLSGLTATSTELNHLDGITATTTELNYTDGVTSAIQTQLNSKITSPAAQSNIDSSAVGQAQLKTTTGEVSKSSAAGTLTAPGGEYAFNAMYKNTPYSASTISGKEYYERTEVNATYIREFVLNPASQVGNTVYAQERYIQASPPYDLGDGEIPLFIFVEITPSGEVVGVYEAPEAPWHYNGPTNIKANFYKDGKGYQVRKDAFDIDAGMVAAGHPTGLTKVSAKALSMLAYQDYHLAFNSAQNIEVEVTQVIKNADMAIIPRPMEPGAGNTVIMLDPVADLTASLFEMKKHDGFSINELLHEGDLIITSEVVRNSPRGVPVHGYVWR